MTDKNTFEADSIDDEEFDNFTADDLDKVIAKITQNAKAHYIVTEKRFIARLSDGSRVSIPIDVKLKDIDVVTEEFDNPLDQLKAILTKFSGKVETAKLEAAPYMEALSVATAYFQVFQKVSGATVGK